MKQPNGYHHSYQEKKKRDRNQILYIRGVYVCLWVCIYVNAVSAHWKNNESNRIWRAKFLLKKNNNDEITIFSVNTFFSHMICPFLPEMG